MLKRMALLLGVLVVVTWLAASAFVALYEPGGLPDTTLVLTHPEGERPRWELAHPPPRLEEPEGIAFMPLYGEGARGSVGSGTGGVVSDGHTYLLVRGALDTAHGRFPLAVGLVFWGVDLPAHASIEVTTDADWGDADPADVAWEVLGSADLETGGRFGWIAVEGTAPAGTAAWRRTVTTRYGGQEAYTMSMLRPRKRLDRIVEDLSAYGLFRWLARTP